MTKKHDPNRVFDDHADDYSEEIDKTLNKFGTDHDLFTRHKSWLIIRELKALEKEPSKLTLLDVGCGIGKIHPLIGPSLGSVIGTDISAPSLEVARAANPGIQYRDYDGDTLPIENSSVDVTLAICVFHHVPPTRWAQMAKEMLRVLKPGGLAMIIEHNPFNPLTRRIVNTCPLDADAVLLSARELSSLFRGAGSRRVVSRYIVSLPPKNVALMWADRLFSRLPMGAQYYTIAHKPLEVGVANRQ